MKKFTKIISALLCISCAAAALSGCKTGGAGNDEEYVSIVVVNWPQETSPETRAVYEGYVEKLQEKYPNIIVKGEEYGYSPDTFLPKAAANQLPNLYTTFYSEKSIEDKLKASNEDGKSIITPTVPFSIWEDAEILDVTNELQAKYANVSADLWPGIQADGLIIKPEEPVNCQELYDLLDIAIQKVLIDEASDPQAILNDLNRGVAKRRFYYTLVVFATIYL